MAKRKGMAVRYDRASERVVVSYSDGAELWLPIDAFPAAADGTHEQRATVRLGTTGNGIRWDVFDADYYQPYLMAVMLGPKEWHHVAASGLASRTSPARARAARANGAKGGRPRKHARA